MATALNKKVRFIPSDSFDNIHTYALVHILLSDNVHSQFFLIADGDTDINRADNLIQKVMSKAPKDKLGRLDDLKSRIHVLSEHELEWYFLDVVLLANVMHDFPQKELAGFLEFYHQKYKKALRELKANISKESRAKFVHDYRPSLLFQSPGDGEKYKRYLRAYDNNEAFMQSWSKLATSWKSKLVNGRPPIELLIGKTDIRKHFLLKELAAIIDKILGTSEQPNNKTVKSK